MGNTKTTLVKDLKNELVKRRDLTDEQVEQIHSIIELAKEGHYHDFQSDIAMPKMQLIEDLREAGLTELVQKVADGVYDEEIE